MTEPNTNQPANTDVNNEVELTEEEQYALEQSKLPWSEREYKERKNPKIAMIPPRPGVVVGTGDNKKIIDPEEVYKLAALHCSLGEICDWFGISRKILNYNFAYELAKGKADAKQQLRKAQFNTALSGNATLLIWLGKQMLGQSDNPAPESNENEIVEFNVKLITKDAEGNAVIDGASKSNEQDAETVEEQ